MLFLVYKYAILSNPWLRKTYNEKETEKMQGYILKTTRSRDEDLIVTILTKNNLYTLYRFYGARHSPIGLGNKIDFTIEPQVGYMDRLRNVLHLGFVWQKEMEKVLVWQQFIRLLYDHLKEIETIDEFYYDLLEELTRKLKRQNPKRAVLEGYVKLLEHEGRLHKEPVCFLCEGVIKEDPVYVRSFLPAHHSCVPKPSVRAKAAEHLFTHYDSQYLCDAEVEILFQTLCEGL
jgi:recombinational DNA repair protein (RecF pathway)